MNPTPDKPTFSTDNFALATFLKAKVCILLHISKESPRRAVFIFDDTPERKKLTEEFWRGDSSVEPRSFYNSQRELKMFLYDNSYPNKG